MCAGGELFMQLEREGIFMEDTAWWVVLICCYVAATKDIMCDAVQFAAGSIL